jgi:phage terminase large subunit-like protein
MAATTDMTAAVAGAWNEPGECRNCRQTSKSCLDVEARFWMPGDTLAGSKTTWSKDMLAQLRRWVDDGWLEVVDGAVIDDSDVKAGIHEWAETSDVTAVAVDPWQARQLRIDLEDEGFIIFEHPQTMRAMSPPTKELVDLIVDGRFHHGGHPILRWMADNTVGQTDADGNVKPSRRKSSGKIDGIVASVMLVTASTVVEESSFGISLL